jgi:prepilin-type N-terminal cleavage/methylation domain-containing protein
VPQIRRGLSLIEVVIVIALISVLMVLSLPMMSNANARARAELCQQNLIEMGQSISSYAQDTESLPTLYAIEPIHPGLSLSEFINSRMHTPQVVYCPSDETEKSHTLGTSYQWSSAFNGLPVNQLTNLVGQRMLGDREAFHLGSGMQMNELSLGQSDAGLHLSLVGIDYSGETTDTPDIVLTRKSRNPKNKKDKKHNGHGHAHGHDKD